MIKLVGYGKLTRSDWMKTRWFQLISGSLQEQRVMDGWQQAVGREGSESWFDIDPTDPTGLKPFLEKLGLHPVQVARCLDSVNEPGVVSFGNTLLMEYPAAFGVQEDEPGYLSIILCESFLVTVRHGPIPALDALEKELTAEGASPLRHLPQILYLILDQFADLNVDAQIEVRDRILNLSKDLAANPNSVTGGDLSRLRWKVDGLVSLIENQLYCISALNASDNPALKEPHRKAFIQDLASEAEIAQRGVYRLENRLNNLYSDFQVAGNDRVEKRLRVLTLISAITLPLGLIAGLLGMNVGGLPGTSFRYGFLVVIGFMAFIGVLQYWYFKHNGWFD
jgi:Mg2+ and Co2+ transporter CorA